ncbi:cyclic AMP-dependent transcription factor ATF-4-like [Mercenaria mercenaria]|uniref:cyclic AMP-dependent transcription factor ATF-4-like n=1 Tax=Mercenaria mercenaria TaxID=6596 RepID=UPI00234F4705|nr:cyclic AMP-dependent transcription factor ATF-4-like [Mercenaria mercenaria]
MEFTDQQMNFLEDTFGLSADLFADDLGTDGSILDLGLDGGLKHQTAAQESLEDLLLADSHADSFGEEWMETVDFQNLLNSDSSSGIGPTVVKVEKQEPRKEGMKQAAFELLKALLTGQQPAKTELSLDLMQPIEQVETPSVISPAAEVPDIDFPGYDSLNTLLGGVDNQVIHSFEDLIQPEISLDNGDVIEILPVHSGQNLLFNSVSSLEDSVVVLHEDSFNVENQDASSPLSNADIESVLSSSPTSPAETCHDITTVDSSCLSDSNMSSTAKSIQVSSEDFTKLKSKSKKVKTKSSPYDSDNSPVSDKRLRKKMQNKNAATRYREKKRHEKETLQEQEVRLSDKNKELREKVESLQREILYMKELMNEINKAKQSKI